jgi:hypothetical protein
MRLLRETMPRLILHYRLLRRLGKALWELSTIRFRFLLRFKSASTNVQDGLKLDVTPFDYDTASRQGILRITDNYTDGFSVGWWDVIDNGSGSYDFQFTDLGTNLDRDTWYDIFVTMTFNDGALDDKVTVNFSGNSTEFNSWERYYETFGGVQPSLAPVDSVILRASDYNNPVASLQGGGVYFDDFTMEVSNVPIPGGLWLFVTGILGFVGYRRKRKS